MMTELKIVPTKDVDLLMELMTSPYCPESFEDASISVIFVNHFALPVTSDVDIVETTKLMKEYIAKNGGNAFSYDWKIVDGVLYADGNVIKRVGSSDRKIGFDPMADYWEARCIAKGEPVD